MHKQTKGSLIRAGLVAVSSWLLWACVPQQPPPAPQPPPAVAAVAQPPASPRAPGKGPFWDVRKVRCADLLNAADEDRDAAAMFYYGYLAARSGIHVIDVSMIDANIHRVMEQCSKTPDLTVVQAYTRAFARRLKY